MAFEWLGNTFSPKHIVMIDDDTDYLHMVCDILENKKYTVTIASSWSDLGSLDALEDVDLFLLDIFLSTKPNGPQIALRLRKERENAPICFLSGQRCSLEEEQTLTHLGKDLHFLSKSVSPEAILHKVAELTGNA